MNIKITNHDSAATFALNDSPAAQDLLKQLPLTITVKNYSSDEKVFYPTPLSVKDTPASKGQAGDLAYFAPWDDVAIFYRDFSAAPGLYQLGHCIAGQENLAKLTGEIKIEQA